MSNPYFEHLPLPNRAVRPLPDGKRIAVWVGLNVEYYQHGLEALSLAPFTSGLVPDPLNEGWREYGARVGIWRLIDMFDQLGLSPTVIANSAIVREYPDVVAAICERSWDWVAHGQENTTWQVGMGQAQERRYILAVADELHQASGVRPLGWLGPALTASPYTNELLADLGFQYTLDWGFDDLPVDMTVPSGRLLSVPYSTELNDIPFYALHGASGPDFRQALIDQFDQLRREGGERPRVMGFGVHPFLSGQPYRVRYLREALQYMQQFDDVWFTSADRVAQWHLDDAS